MQEKAHTWFESSDTVTMFPTQVWRTQLAPERHRFIAAVILTLLDEQRRDQRPLAPADAWQSAQALHELAELKPLVGCINAAAEHVLEILRIGYDAFEITGCWANIYALGASHGIHSHPNNFLSGVYYVMTQPGADTINFHDPRIQTGIIRPPVTELTAGNTDQVVLRVVNGTLLLFPSYLQHSVDPNRSDAPRISVSFNIMFSGFTAAMSKPLWAPTPDASRDPHG